MRHLPGLHLLEIGDVNVRAEVDALVRAVDRQPVLVRHIGSFLGGDINFNATVRIELIATFSPTEYLLCLLVMKKSFLVPYSVNDQKALAGRSSGFRTLT